MLTRAELHEMRDLTTRVHAGSISREDWANLAALTLIWHGDAVVTAIAEQGFDRFLDTSGPVYARHGFHRSDYRRIYRRVCEAAARAVRDRVH